MSSAGAPRAARILALAIGLVYVAVFLLVALGRIGYPFELEWMEGGAIAHVQRILAGQALYVPPSLDFVPFIYSPLYFYLSAGPSAVLGVGFVPLRLVSLVAALGCLVLIYLHVKRETGDRPAALLSACLFAAIYEISGAWLDLARVDSLFLLFLLAAIYALRAPASWSSQLAAGLLLSLSFLTKQTALVAGAPLMLWALWFRRRLSLWFIGPVIGIIGLTTLLLDLAHDGWYAYYLFQPSQDPGVPRVLLTFWTEDLLAQLPVALLLVVAYFWGRLAGDRREAVAFYVLLAVGTLGASWFSRLRSGGYLNVLLPAYACLSLLFGLGAHRLLETIRKRGGPRSSWLETAVYAAVAVQLALLAYDPRRLVPSPDDLRAGNECVAKIAEFDGEVYVPFHAYLADRAGKRAWGSGNAGGDVFRSGDNPTSRALVGEIRLALREQRFAAILLDDSVLIQWSGFWPLFRDDLDRFYTVSGPVFERDDVFWPTTGTPTRPELILIPAGAGERPEPD